MRWHIIIYVVFWRENFFVELWLLIWFYDFPKIFEILWLWMTKDRASEIRKMNLRLSKNVGIEWKSISSLVDKGFTKNGSIVALNVEVEWPNHSNGLSCNWKWITFSKNQKQIILWLIAHIIHFKEIVSLINTYIFNLLPY